MTVDCSTRTRNGAALTAAIDAAIRAIPPLWPLASSVAVNPYLGQTGRGLAQTAALLERVAGVSSTMPRSWYQERIAGGVIDDHDLARALESAAPSGPPDLATLKAAALAPRPAVVAAPTVADLAAGVSGIDWPGFIEERFGAWAAGYVDDGQALWAAPRERSSRAESPLPFLPLAWESPLPLDLAAGSPAASFFSVTVRLLFFSSVVRESTSIGG